MHKNTFRREGVGRGSALLFITLKKYSVMVIFMCIKPAGHTWGYFPTTAEWGLFVCCLFALLFSPHLVLSFILILFFTPGIFSFWSSKMRIFKSFFVQQVFIFGASKHLNISAVFPWIVLICQTLVKPVVFGWTQYSLRSKFSLAYWLNRLIISCPLHPLL